ncbi:MAG: hypothetical protein HZC10_10625 [Nitrospirae bacterium]|nr:hypothetical protein [Nitrospirota bacterium]
MNKNLKTFYFVLLMNILFLWPSFTEGAWQFKLTHETSKLIDTRFYLMTTADLNRNNVKELIVTDFGRFGDHMGEWGENGQYYNMLVLEWEGKELKLKWKKKWDMSIPKTRDERDKYFMAYQARQMVAWAVGDRIIVETIPPYLGLEWVNGKYIIHEQYGSSQESKVGSWALPWLSPFCYYGHFAWSKMIPPRECLVGIRDFSGKGKPKIVTILEEEIEKKKYKQTLRVRRFEPGFPIEWEMVSSKRFAWWDLPIVRPIDRLNQTSDSSLLMTAFGESSWYLFEPNENSKSYRIKPLPALGPMGIEFYDLPDIYLRSTQRKSLKEYWGYHRVDIPHPERHDFMLLLKKVKLNPNLTGFESEVVDFQRHKQFLDVGYFDLKDLDDDGLDEIILIEETGKKELIGQESVEYSDVKDYIRILKWDGKRYLTMWVSPPYTKRGTKFLVEDIKNTGKKQLVVMTPYGTIQIWERILK